MSDSNQRSRFCRPVPKPLGQPDIYILIFGADKGTRTHTPLAQHPKCCVSTNSTISANWMIMRSCPHWVLYVFNTYDYRDTFIQSTSRTSQSAISPITSIVGIGGFKPPSYDPESYIIILILYPNLSPYIDSNYILTPPFWARAAITPYDSESS